MTNKNTHGYPVLILGAGRGGLALLEMFLADDIVEVVGIADSDPDAPGNRLAAEHDIPVFLDVEEALQFSKSYPDCIVYNLTHDDTIDDQARNILERNNVTGGQEAKLFWQMVTNLKQTKEDLYKIQEELKAVIYHAMDGIITIGETGEIQGFNPAAEKIFGYAQKDVLGKSMQELIPESIQSEKDIQLKSQMRTGMEWITGSHGREVTAVRANGEVFPMELSASEMMLHGQRYFIGIVRDITERKQAEQKIMHLAHYDQLTGLPNRVLFFDFLKKSVNLAKRNGHKQAVMFLDLDGFKCVNDTLGHSAGDLLLREVADRLQQVVRSSDITARVGGDEFTFVLNNIGEKKHAASIAEKILEALAEPFSLKDQQCQIGGSIGIALFPEDSEDFETLLMQADDAMYVSKQQGKNTYSFFSE